MSNDTTPKPSVELGDDWTLTDFKSVEEKESPILNYLIQQFENEKYKISG